MSIVHGKYESELQAGRPAEHASEQAVEDLMGNNLIQQKEARGNTYENHGATQ